ncbi:MAG: hypothetical protein ACUVRO_11085 [Armatimonadota bacterium]
MEDQGELRELELLSEGGVPATDTVQFVRYIFDQAGQVKLDELFTRALQMSDYFRVLRDVAAVRLSKDLPEILDVLVQKAREGRAAHIKMVLEVCGLTRSSATVNTAVQINISQDELDRLRRGLEDRVTVVVDNE